MASNEAPAATTAAGDQGDINSRTVTLHILCPSQPIPGRFTLNDLPLETTIGELRARITQSLPSQPPPAAQRLIYRGRPLTTDSQMLSEILGSVEVGLAIATPSLDHWEMVGSPVSGVTVKVLKVISAGSINGGRF